MVLFDDVSPMGVILIKHWWRRTFIEDALVPKDNGLKGSVGQESVEDVSHRLGSSLVVHGAHANDVYFIRTGECLVSENRACRKAP